MEDHSHKPGQVVQITADELRYLQEQRNLAFNEQIDAIMEAAYPPWNPLGILNH